MTEKEHMLRLITNNGVCGRGDCVSSCPLDALCDSIRDDVPVSSPHVIPNPFTRDRYKVIVKKYIQKYGTGDELLEALI